MGINKSVLEGIWENAYDYGINLLSIANFLTVPCGFRERQSKAKEIIEDIMIEHGKKELLKPVAQLAEVEYGIRGIDSRVRDHVVHALLSFLLGIFINEHFLKPREQSVNSFQWKLAGLFHDVGYPAQIGQDILTRYMGQLNNIKKELSCQEPDFYFKTVPVGLNKLTNGVDSFDLIQNCLDRWRLKIDAKDEYANSVKSGKVCHGIISSLSVLSIIDMLYDKHNLENIHNPHGINWNQLHFEKDVVPACAAVFVHNLPEQCFQQARLDRNRAPLPYLLRLSDCLQDWERPSANDLKGCPDSDFDICMQSDRLVFMVANSTRRNRIKEEITSTILDPDIEICDRRIIT